jgi:hypothetical protein
LESSPWSPFRLIFTEFKIDVSRWIRRLFDIPLAFVKCSLFLL